MPNSAGVFYKSGKFHISKLSTDLVAFAGQVEATGIALADNQKTGSSLPGAATSIVLPTATQVVDYVQQTVTAGAEYDLAGGSASSLESSFAYNSQLADDGNGTVKTEKERLDDMFAEFAELIADAAQESEVRDNTMQSAIAFIDADGTYTNAKLGASAIAAQTAVQAFTFPAPAQTTLKADMEARFDAIHSAFDALAKVSEDQDNAIEASVGLSNAGGYAAPSWSGGSFQVWDVSVQDPQGNAVGGFVSYSGSEITAATTVKNADELLRAMIQENNVAFTTLMAGNNVDFDTLQEIVSAYQMADTEVLTALTLIATDAVGFSWSDLDNGSDGINPTLTMSALSAEADSGVNTVARGLAATAASNLRAMVIESRGQIQDTFEGVQSEIEAIEAGAGLTVGTGAYVAPLAVQYLLTASSLKDADMKLDAEIKVVNERLSDKHGSESLLDYNSFDSDGASLPVPAVRSADFALSAGYNVVDALNELAQGASSSISDLQDELDRTQASIGFDLLGTNTDGSNYSPAFAASTNGYFATGASLMAVVGDIRTAADAAFEGFESGTGLGQDGAYSANTSADYIPLATSLQDADDKLDAVLKAEETDRIASDTDQLARIGRIIAAAGLDTTAGSEGAFVAYTGNLLSGATTMYAADVALESEIISVASDLYANPANVFGGFTIAGGTQSTFEDAINALDTLIGDDADLDVVADSGNGAVALATETYSLKGGASSDAGATVNIATSWDDTAKEMSISLDASPNVKDLTADEYVSAPIMSGKVHVHHYGFEAAEAISAGDIIAVNMSAYTITQTSDAIASVVKADNEVASADKSKVVGIAWDKTSINGEIASTASHAVGSVVGFITSGLIKGFDLSGCSNPAVGEELYLGAAGKVTNVAPSGDGAASADYVSIHKIGMIVATGAAFSDCAVLIDMKHMANEA